MRRIVRHVAIHGSLVLFAIGEAFALDAQLKQLTFGGPLTPRNIEGRTQMMWIAIAFLVLAIIVGVAGQAVWMAATIGIHSLAMLLWFNSGWGATVVPTALVCVTLWVVWVAAPWRRRMAHPGEPGAPHRSAI